MAFGREAAVVTAMERGASQSISPTVFPVRNVDVGTCRRRWLMMGGIGRFLDDNNVGRITGISSIACCVVQVFARNRKCD